MILYRIYTEDKNCDDIIDFVHSFLDGFTTYNGVGYWRGQAELCLVIEIIGTEADDLSVRGIAAWIQKHNAQESVAITKQEVTVETVGDQL